MHISNISNDAQILPLIQKPYTQSKVNTHRSKILLVRSLLAVACFSTLYAPFINSNVSSAALNSIIACMMTFIGTTYAMTKLSRYPGNSSLMSLPSLVLIHVTIAALIFISFRLEYSRLVLSIGILSVPITLFVQHHLIKRLTQASTYLVTPFGCFQSLKSNSHNQFILLSTPGFGENNIKHIDGVLFDQHEKLDGHWQQFLASSANRNIPLYDTTEVYESINGKSPLDHLPELSSGSLKPHWLYRSTKRILESLLILVTSPAWLSLVLFTALLIKLESKGPAFFIQRRVGQGGKEFSMVKLRSMRTDSEANGAQFAGEDDPRITKIGKFIRKVRIDEIPQFFNVLKGEMALIGPRPEQASFVKEFEEKIPLYSMRHVVKPGITGWAQVTHGYADDEESTKEKLAHDFYYVKNISLWLDIMVVFKTIKTMLIGFGAR
ncbi:sugar transferase [Bermanella marisrubri]|uniref:UDP-glucose lipid carrier transferase n=1 Tax=Bermanella marisrubri TaxID=207949 RepID=Q1N5A3_9GAMM|nr:sugar transferase [Bermanella marisrubri]EAT13145.1 UDP-glucose lipid carrier transferase [Oceanobacter sp. RED65] [Bermanella marisrubri]QIZ83921.1 sugar transferase [Bermanella marisrubri]